MEKLKIKEALWNQCKIIIENRIDIAKSAMENAQKAANGEEKSTAGDKYDTSRAMGHIDRDMNAVQVSQAVDTLNILKGVEIASIHTKAKSGTVILTSMGNYFLSVSAGNIKLDDVVYFAISPISPMGQLLLNKSKGDKFTFNSKSVIIQELF